VSSLPWEIELWQRRKPGRRVERQVSGAVVLVDVLRPAERRNLSKRDVSVDELRRTFPSLSAACAAVAL
jgi:hypothetical protein